MKFKVYGYGDNRKMSPSPRRAWIEMEILPVIIEQNGVALPTEGVD